MKILPTVLLSLSLFLTVAMEPVVGATIKAVVFDFNGVIIKNDRSLIANFIAKSFDLSQKEALQILAEMKRAKLKEVQEEMDFWTHFAQSKRTKLPKRWWEQYRQVKISASKEIPGMVDLVKSLQDKKIVTALLTNTKKKEALLKNELGLYDLFEPRVFSYLVGVEKPNPKIYRHLLNKLQLPAQDVLFIDNKSDNVEAAKKIGMDAILFIDTPQLIEELNTRIPLAA